MSLSSVVFIEEPSENDYATITGGINQYAAKLGIQRLDGFFFVIYDDQQKIVAGITGYNNFGPAEIASFWVDEQYRHAGYGKLLLTAVEKWAKEKGCQALTVFTLQNWQACAWYQKMGFEIEFVRENHASHSAGCYLMKTIA